MSAFEITRPTNAPCEDCRDRKAKGLTPWKCRFHLDKQRVNVENYQKRHPERVKARRAARDPEGKKQADLRWKEKHPDYQLVRSLQRRNLTVEEYDQMLAAQNGVCAICERKCTKFKRLSVDHDHLTQIIRGLLCDRCNNGLARFLDSIQLLKAAIRYLEKFICA